jgi:hypothetical protein
VPPKVRIHVQAYPGSNKVKIFTSAANIRPKTVKVSLSQELFAEFRMYKTWLITDQGVEVDVTMPNVFRAFLESRILPAPPGPNVKFCSICGKKIEPDEKINLNRAAHDRCAREEGAFQVNMMEALVGWKGWNFGSGHLWSTYRTQWLPEKEVQAVCPDGKCETSPTETCGCGIYAAGSIWGAQHGPTYILGQVYGWGRYIRGGQGWRAQFAYPKAFFIEKDQMEYFESLKKYRVPIYVNQPLKLYAPEDDGYEGEQDEYRRAETDGDCRTSEESDAEET